MEIRSFRRVFDLERRIYSIDRFRLNPGGVPVRGILYLLGLVALSAIARRVLGSLASALPWYAAYLILPGVGAALLGAIRIEGRPFDVAAAAILRQRLAPRGLAALDGRATVGSRWRPDDLLILPDGSEGELRALRYSGPGVVLVRVAHTREGVTEIVGAAGVPSGMGRRTVTVRPARSVPPEREGSVISLAAGARMLVRAR